MILVDTSVWITHFREGDKKLVDLLDKGEVVTHPFIIGELACGNLKNRTVILNLLKELPTTIAAKNDEVLSFIENHKLMGKGLGYVDIHLLASSILTDTSLWTLDKTLNQTAKSFTINYVN